MKSRTIGFAALLRLLPWATLLLTLGWPDAPPDALDPSRQEAVSATAEGLSGGDLPKGEASAEAGPTASGCGIAELPSAPRRATRAHAGRADVVPLRCLEGHPSRIRAVTRSRIGFVRAMAEASAGTSTQSTALPPPALL